MAMVGASGVGEATAGGGGLLLWVTVRTFVLLQVASEADRMTSAWPVGKTVSTALA